MNPDDLGSRLRQVATGDRRRTAECPDDNTVAAYVDGTLEPPDLDLVEAHLADCGACVSLVGELSRDRGTGHLEPVPELVQARARRLGKANRGGWMRYVPHALAAAMAVVSVSVLIHFMQVPEVDSEMVVTPDPRTTRNGASTAVALKVLSPIAGETVAADQLVFHWTEVAGSPYYEVHIVSDSGDLVDERRVTSTEWRPTANLHLRPGAEYFVRIDAHPPESRTVSSVHVPFSIADPR